MTVVGVWALGVRPAELAEQHGGMLEQGECLAPQTGRTTSGHRRKRLILNSKVLVCLD